MRWAMRKSGVEEWLVQVVMALYSGVAGTDSDGFV